MGTTNTPQIMGIININNDSFYKNSRCTNQSDIAKAFENMIESGADIIDIGACSTRPGSTPISQEQEWEMLEIALKVIAAENYNKKVKISIDTFRSEIVSLAHKAIGEFIVNDISAGEDDSNMLQTVGKLKLPYIAMHKRGNPQTMQLLTQYPNGVVNHIIEYFTEFNKRANEFGITEYIVDPGFGFAKTIEQNYQLFNGIPYIIEQIEKISNKKRDILVGISRKSMIYKPLNILANDSLEATTALNLQALLLGAKILRVHDVAAAKQCCKLYELLQNNK